MYVPSFFIDNSTDIHYAARVPDLNSLAQLIVITILYFLRHLRQNCQFNLMQITLVHSGLEESRNDRGGELVRLGA